MTLDDLNDDWFRQLKDGYIDGRKRRQALLGLIDWMKEDEEKWFKKVLETCRLADASEVSRRYEADTAMMAESIRLHSTSLRIALEMLVRTIDPAEHPLQED